MKQLIKNYSTFITTCNKTRHRLNFKKYFNTFLEKNQYKTVKVQQNSENIRRDFSNK